MEIRSIWSLHFLSRNLYVPFPFFFFSSWEFLCQRTDFVLDFSDFIVPFKIVPISLCPISRYSRVFVRFRLGILAKIFDGWCRKCPSRARDTWWPPFLSCEWKLPRCIILPRTCKPVALLSLIFILFSNRKTSIERKSSSPPVWSYCSTVHAGEYSAL